MCKRIGRERKGTCPGERMKNPESISTHHLYFCNSDTIQTVRKERVFEQDVTEKEMDIIQQRIAFQQRQFAAFEEKEKLRRYRKLKQHYGYLVEAEMDEALEDCANDEDDVFAQFSTRGYLEKIRRTIAIRNHKPAKVTVMDDQQRARYEEHLKKRREAPRMRTTETMKKYALAF